MDTIKLLDEMETGMYCTVILNNDIRCVSIYMGQPSPHIFQFIDETGIYRLSAGYIKEHKIKIDNQLEDNELFIVAKLLDEIKKRGE